MCSGYMLYECFSKENNKWIVFQKSLHVAVKSLMCENVKKFSSVCLISPQNVFLLHVHYSLTEMATFY